MITENETIEILGDKKNYKQIGCSNGNYKMSLDFVKAAKAIIDKIKEKENQEQTNMDEANRELSNIAYENDYTVD